MRLLALVMAAGLAVLPDPPAAPTGLGATPGNAQISLDWNDVAQVDGYNVYRAPVSSGNFTKLNSQLLTTSGPYVDAGLNPGTRYFYKVKAQNSEGEGPYSSEVSAIPEGTDNIPPLPPFLLSTTRKTRDATPSTNGTAEPGTTVTVYSGETAIGSAEVALNGNWTVANPSSLGSDGIYTITAKATDAASNQSPPSGPITITLDTTPPPAPTNVRTTAYHNCVDIEWRAPASDDLAGYIVQRRTTSGSWTSLNSNVVVGTKYRDATATNGTTYHYRVIAVDDALDY